MAKQTLLPHRLQTRMVFSIVLLTSLVVVVSTMVLGISSHYSRTELLSSNGALLKQCMNQIEEILSKTERLSTSFVLGNAYLGPFMSGRKHSAYEKYRFQKEFSSYYSSLSTLYPGTISVYIYSAISGDLFVNGALYINNEFGDEDYLREILLEPTRGKWLGGVSIEQYTGYRRFSSKNAVLMARNYPLGTTDGSKGIYTIVIDTDKLISILTQTLPADHADVWIVNRESNALVAATGHTELTAEDKLTLAAQYAGHGESDEPLAWGGKKYLLSGITSPYTEWLYLLSVPENGITAWISTVGYVFTAAVLGFFLIVLLLWYAMFSELYRPLGRLVTQVSMTVDGDAHRMRRNELSYLGDVFNALLARHNELEEMIKSFQPDMRHLLVSDLTQIGYVTDFEQHIQQMRSVGLSIHTDVFCVALINIAHDETGAIEKALNDVLATDGPSVGVVFTRRDESSSLLLFSAQGDRIGGREDRQYLESALKSAISQAHMDNVAIGLGQIYTSYQEIPLSYSEADLALKQCLRDGIAVREHNTGGARLANKAVRHMDENFSDTNLNANSVADALGITVSHLSRVFKGNTGMSVSDYLTQLRVERAKHLLKSTRLTVANIAVSVGYINQQTFIRAYKKKTGITPGGWRNDTAGYPNGNE